MIQETTPILIGINGRLGSGKDTVGGIIQYLLHVQQQEKEGKIPNLGLHTFLSVLAGTNMPDWKIKKFASKLKQIASLLTGVPIHKWEDQDFKNQDMPSEWDYLKQMFECDEKSRDGFDVMPMTYRKFLQRLGTEAIRDGLHPEAWVNALFADYVPVRRKVEDEEYETFLPSWIITDMRFPNEYEAVKSRGGLCVRVERKKRYLGALVTPDTSQMHPSEAALDSHSFDWVLNNSGTIEELVEEVRKMLIHFKLLEK